MGSWGDALFILKTYGPLVLVAAFMLWQAWAREKRMSERITKLEQEHKDILLPLAAHNAEVVGQNTLMLSRLEEALRYRADCPYLRNQLIATQIAKDAVA